MEKRRRGCSCIPLLVFLVAVVALGAVAYTLWLRPLVGELIAGQGGPQSELEGEIDRQGPTVVAALPSGTLTISDADINSYIQANKESLRGVDNATIRFTPGVVTAELSALGTTSTATTGLSVADGRLVAVDPRLQGPLSAVVQADAIAQALTNQLNQQLTSQGRRASSVSVEQGQLVIVIE